MAMAMRLQLQKVEKYLTYDGKKPSVAFTADYLQSGILALLPPASPPNYFSKNKQW